MRLVVALLMALGCVAVPPAQAEFKAKARDFKCLLKGVQPAGKHFYVFNRNKRKLKKAVAVAEGNIPGEEYPVGTIIQLLPFEAMAKRGGTYNPSGHGWEFFRLSTSPANKSEIVDRGKEEVKNFASCQGCHLGGQAAEYDLICEGHGAASLPLTDAQIDLVQHGDPRCRK
jgi:hypothetical protein